MIHFLWTQIHPANWFGNIVATVVLLPAGFATGLWAGSKVRTHLHDELAAHHAKLAAHITKEVRGNGP